MCTGGEPLLQLDAPLIAALHARGFEVAIETNGTLAAPEGIDWICVSPKAGAALRIVAGDELKLIHPQPDAAPEDFERLDFAHFFLQPMDGPAAAKHPADGGLLPRAPALEDQPAKRTRFWNMQSAD